MEQLTLQYSLPTISTGLTKTQVANLVEVAVQAVLDEGNPFQVAEALAAMEDFTKGIRADARFQAFLLEELKKHNDKLQTASGAKIEACETGVKYDYSQNSDWVALDNDIKRLEERRKAIEEKLKKIPAGKLLVDEDGGETLVGPAKSSKSNYKLTLAK